MAAQAGASFAGYFDHIAGTTGTAEGLNFSQLGLQSSPLYGGKVGYYFDEPGWKWLGIEMEAFTSTQHLKQQGVEYINATGGTTTELTSGQNVRVTNWAPSISCSATRSVGSSLMLEVDWESTFSTSTMPRLTHRHPATPTLD